MTYQLVNARVWDGSQWVAAVDPTPAPAPAKTYPNPLHDVSTSVSVGGTAHTKTAWVEVIASTSSDTNLLLVDAAVFQNATETSWLVDFAVGAAGAESAIVENIYVGSSNQTTPRVMPINIPAGSRLSVRAQSNRTSVTATVRTQLFVGDSSIASSTCTVIGTSTTTSRPTLLASANVYVQLVASTASSYKTLIMCAGAAGSALPNAGPVGCELATGAAGSETVIASSLMTTNTGELSSVGRRAAGPTDFYFTSVPSGTRLAIRRNLGDASIGGFVIAVPA